MTGKFSLLFRTGAEADSAFEQILQSLNQARGTAYAVEPGTAIYVENYAFAKAINDLWISNQRMVNQFDPHKMGVFIDRWEKIYGITTHSNSLEKRKAVIAAKMSLATNAPITQVVSDLCRAYLGDLFVEVNHYTALDNEGGVPGGATVVGGVTLPDDIWFSPISLISVRTWQKRDKLDNIMYDERQYQKDINDLSAVLDGFLPAYMIVNTYRYTHSQAGTISYGAYNFFVGDGTAFSGLQHNDKIEVVDNDGNVNTFTVDYVDDDFDVYIIEPIPNNFTGCTYRTSQFILDQAHNLDNEIFGVL
ncbi:MAG: hypothetical protein WAZ75_00115 [Candidatus Absconditicoccaceae bacterium]